MLDRKRFRNSNSDGPHSPPGQSPSPLQAPPGFEPPTHVDGAQAPPGQSSPMLQGSPPYVPVVHDLNSGPRRATRTMVYGASAEPNSVISLSAPGLDCGSKTGGRGLPSGARAVRKARPGIRIGDGTPTKRSMLVLPRRMRGTGIVRVPTV